MAATELDIAEMALGRIGHAIESDPGFTTSSGTDVANITDTDNAAIQVMRWYPRCRNELLERHPWGFATKFATLVSADDGTGEAWVDEWDRAYTWPSDCLVPRRLVTDTHRYESNPCPFRVVQHDSAKVILSDVSTTDADLEYTFENSDTTEYPELFVQALVLLLAYRMGPSVKGLEAGELRAIFEEYLAVSQAAMANDGNQEHNHPQDESTYVSVRGGD